MKRAAIGLAATWLLAFGLLGCAHRRASQGLAVPTGCATNLTGSWEHEGNMSYRYEAKDDGTTATFLPERVNADGTGAESFGDASSAKDMLMTLRRGDAGFLGEFRMLVDTDTGQSCGVLFQAQVTACAPDRITLQVEQSYSVNEACQRVSMGAVDLVEHVLVRRK